MGHYRKKTYKKKSIDPFHQKEMMEDYYSEIDFFKENNDEEVLNEILPEEEPLLDEPEIVTQLREEERLGKLPFLYPSYNDDSKRIINNLYNPDTVQTQMKSIGSMFERKSYEETLDIARKSFEKEKNNEIKSIKFIEDENV